MHTYTEEAGYGSMSAKMSNPERDRSDVQVALEQLEKRLQATIEQACRLQERLERVMVPEGPMPAIGCNPTSVPQEAPHSPLFHQVQAMESLAQTVESKLQSIGRRLEI